MAKPVVAIVGRPNVGKSTLFNKIAGTRISIVDDTPGVTRDRVFADAEWLGRDFTLIDTGGIEPKADDEILSQMRAQAQLAIEMAHVVIFIVNVRDGLTAADKDVAALLIKSGKPIVLAVNKVDNTGDPPMDFYEFYNLGLGDPVAISSTHGLGVGDLLDECAKHFPSAEEGDEEEDIIKVAVVGKPNAGKSSLINRILGEERVIVTNIAGTTRDAIDTHYERNGQKYTFIDTAGIRRKSKVDEQIERYSVIRAFAAVERSDVCIIMIDGAEGITEQDSKIAGFVHESGKAAIVVVNKWDIVEKETNTMKNYKLDILDTLAFMQYAPIQFISAKTGARVDKLFDMINAAAEQNARRITTGMLNDVIGEATAKVQPPSDKGKRLRIYYATQASTKPPTFVIFVNKAELFHFSYQRYLENQLRAAFGFEGTPIRFIIRERGDKK
ncbi:MAG TPA: ribosome biogenesis GTPase Der [Candidatus Aphodoplasma excrementigallinarum]|uniref:GTPase Der n=1 Tax=Candidatus Aphodoplasma excrementigallinarum TaxID=2840673 RepID=A0A9D1T0Y4_9FIRM|nr:ribosome biogenesis GTPase Der [Candidatus Aphodoplasma excrementigallinarum]